MKIFYVLIFLVIAFTSCKNQYYSVDDFSSVEKIDAHFHIYTDSNNSVEQAQKDNFKLFTINTFSGTCDRVVEDHQWLKAASKEHPGEVAFSATFCLDGWSDQNWTENTISWIDKCIAEGANSVKVWKNIGMEFRNKDSVLIMIDDPQFDPVFKHLAEKGIPLVGHLGEPKNCWLPAEEMTTSNDKSYFTKHPQYHMYLHPEFPSYQEQMSARDRMLEKNPNLIFIGCHLASLEWSVDTLAEFLDRFPNAAVDMAARMGQLFYQTCQEREKVRNFFIKYQDRLLYGTDIIDSGQRKKAFQNNLHETWLRDWEYLVTDKTMTSDLIEGKFNGLKLPRDVVDKIYAENFKKWYKSL
ncbi:MAG TPA: amidohydrolase family protein [Draconibacterium sp.]|nr:amidohydrolase family protein [Draconibacterium sp.]